MTLEGIITGPTPKPRRMLVYGVNGIGKSTFASQAPNPIVIQTEEGMDDIGAPRFPLATTLADVWRAIESLRTQEHEYQTLVIDTIDWLEPLIFAEVCAEHGKRQIEEFDYGKGYVFAVTKTRRLLDELRRLSDERGMHILLIGHHEVKRYSPPGAESYDRYMPRLHAKVIAPIIDWATEVLFASYVEWSSNEDQGFNKKRTIAKGAGDRVLRCMELPTHVAKNRIGLPAEIVLDWNTFARYVDAFYAGRPGQIEQPQQEQPA